MTPRLQFIIDVTLTVMMAISGTYGAADSIEQIARIVLLFVSILSGVLLILVNWHKAGVQLKKWLKRE